MAKGSTHEHHIVPFKDYINVFIVLVVLTVITVVASRFDFGSMNTIVALGIASVKAALVLGIFMHLKYDGAMNKAILGTAVFFVVLFYLFCIADIATRIPEISPIKP